MVQYISKSDLVAEIERRIKINKECMLGLRNLDYYQGKVDALNDTISFINSLQKEPKECMYSKDNYTDEDRKVLFGDCEEECEFNKKEEPVSEDLEKAAKEWLRPQLDKSYVNYGEVKMMELTHFDGYAMLDAIEFGAWWQQEKDSIPAEYLEELINKLSKQFPEVSFAKLSRIAVRVANWQKQQDQSTIELAEDHAYFAGRTNTMDEINEALLSEVLPCFMHGGEADEVVAKLDEVLNRKK